MNKAICDECGKEIYDMKNDFQFHFQSNKRFHLKCYKKFYNRANGRHFKCHDCDGTGISPDKKSDNIISEVIGASCESCSGLGYRSVK